MCVFYPNNNSYLGFDGCLDLSDQMKYNFMMLVFFFSLYFWIIKNISPSAFAEPAFSRTEFMNMKYISLFSCLILHGLFLSDYLPLIVNIVNLLLVFFFNVFLQHRSFLSDYLPLMVDLDDNSRALSLKCQSLSNIALKLAHTKSKTHFSPIRIPANSVQRSNYEIAT